MTKRLDPVRSKKIHLNTTSKVVLYSAGNAYAVDKMVVFDGPVALVKKPDGSVIIMTNSRTVIDGNNELVIEEKPVEPAPIDKPKPEPKKPATRGRRTVKPKPNE